MNHAISEEFRINVKLYVKLLEMIKGGNYEKFILEIINKSNEIFAHKQFVRNEDQSHSESDFVDSVLHDKYEVKLAITRKEGRMIGGRENNVIKWIQIYLQGAETDVDYMLHPSRMKENPFYKTVTRRLSQVKDDENAILFIPFPITLTLKESNLCSDTGALNCDYLYFVYQALKRDNRFRGLANGKCLYVIYPTIDDRMVLRDLTNNKIEFIDLADNSTYIELRTSSH